MEAACGIPSNAALVVPLRVQFRLAVPEAGWLPDSRLTARAVLNRAREHQSACECRRGASARQGRRGPQRLCYRSAHPAPAGHARLAACLACSLTPSIDALAVNLASPSATAETAPGAPLLVVGIGCRRGVTLAQVETAVRAALGEWPLERVTAVATLDAKAGESALQAFCAAHALPLCTYTREQIAATSTQAPPCATAQARLGVDGVCEPCARLAASGGPLVRGKLALEGVTVAIASVRHAIANTSSNTASPSPSATDTRR